MADPAVQDDTAHSIGEPPPEAWAGWAVIFEALAKLEAGLRKAEAELGEMRAGLEAFRKSLEVPDGEAVPGHDPR